MLKLLLASPFVLGLVALHSSPALTFDMKDPKGVSGLTIDINGKLEPVHGFANDISGNVVFDPADPKATTGKIVVGLKSLYVGSQPMTDSMHQDWCLDIAKFPTAEFELTKVTDAKTKDGETKFTAVGEFRLHGVSKEMKVSGTATHLPGMIKTRGGMEGVQGDLFVVRTQFQFKRSDFKIAPGLSNDLIGDEVTVKLSSVGVCPK